MDRTLSIAEITTGLQSGKFSSEEVTKSYLDRIEKHSKLNAFIEIAKDSALMQAKEADKRIKNKESAALLGVPIAVKDIIVTKNIRTTCASKILQDWIPPYDATVVEKLKSAGAIIVGKTNMDEFAMGASNEHSAFGTVRNPWNTEYVPGGSSGGSAVAVSAGLSPAALGTDTGGSVRQPASFCNVVGLKPTYGRVSRYGVVAFASSLDQVGTFANTVSDCATVTSVISGHDARDSTSINSPIPDYSAALGKGIKGLKIGVPKEYFIKGLAAEVEQSVRAGINKLSAAGAELVEISLPHTEAALATYYILAPAEASSNLARFDGVRYGHRAKESKDLFDLYCKTRSEGFGNEVKRRIMVGTYVLSAGYFDAFYLKAQKVRALVARDFKEAFTRCDVIACPASPTTAFKIGAKVSDPLSMYLSDVFTIPVNLAGLPGMSVPCGFDSAGLPIGLQLIAKPFDEEMIFRFAAEFERLTECYKSRPVI